jgi:hypothetical protein
MNQVALQQPLSHKPATTLARVPRARGHGCLCPAKRADVALLDVKGRRRPNCQPAADDPLRRQRHSSCSASAGEKLIYFYRAAFGRPIKGLQR